MVFLSWFTTMSCRIDGNTPGMVNMQSPKMLILTNIARRPSTSFLPNYDYAGLDGICGFNGTKPLFPVKTLRVKAGEMIGIGAAAFKGGDESKDLRPVSRSCMPDGVDTFEQIQIMCQGKHLLTRISVGAQRRHRPFWSWICLPLESARQHDRPE